MSSYQTRAPRLDLSFPLEFHCDGDVVKGHCLNLSETGLLGAFDEPLELWTKGEVSLEAGLHTLKLFARVARTMDSEAGLAFCFRSDGERSDVLRLLAFAADQTGLVNRPPF